MSVEIRDIERRLNGLKAKVVICTISDNKVEERLLHRATNNNERVTKEDIKKYIEVQEQLVKFSQTSSLPVQIINTDMMNWNELASLVLDDM